MKVQNKYNHFLLFCLILLLSSIITGQQILSAQKIERYSNKEGFNQNTINTIAQGAYGALWFGTSNGLIKYDGYDFTRYTIESSNETSISNNLIKKLYTDSAGILWIGTVEGMEVYIPSLERFYRVPLPSKVNVSHIAADAYGNIWFSGQKELYVCRLVDVTKGKFEVSENLLKTHPKYRFLNDFYFVDKNTLLIGTKEGLYYADFVRNDQQKWPTIKSITTIPFFSSYNITRLKKIQNIYWIGTTNGLFKASLEGVRMHIIRRFDSTVNNPNNKSTLSVKTIFEDDTGSIWIGSTTEGLSKYLPETESFINYPYNPNDQLGLSSKQINVVFQDNFKVLWIGTAQGGINKLDLLQKKFITYSNNLYNQYALSDNLINGILEDRQGRLWVIGYNKSLCRSIGKVKDNTVNQLKFENLEKEINLREKDIFRSIFEDERGFIWLGTDLSLYVFNPTTNKFKEIKLKTQEPFELNPESWSITQIDKDKILLGGYQIIVLENPWEKIETERNPEIDVHSILDVRLKRVQVILKDNDNKLWCGTSNGLFELDLDLEKRKIELNEITIGGEAIQLSNADIFCLHEDGKGNIWVGTFGGGINKLLLDNKGTPQKIKYYRKNNLLPDDAIYGILHEGADYLWISTDMGLVKFHLETEKTEVFDVRDGLAQNNFRQNAYFLGKSGYFYFGGLNGLTLFKPENIKLNAQVPEILISDLLVNNQVINIGEKLNKNIVLTKSISETESITLHQKHRIIGFNVTVKHTAMPFKNKIAYKLEGLNKDWVEEQTGKTTITYTNLSAGNYRFLVKGANGDGIWNREIKSLNITILPPWYQTWWSYLLFGLLIMGIGAGIVVYFTQHEKLKQRLKYEKIDKERLETINQGKFRFFTNLSHEFKTPLTLIAGPLEHIIANNSDTNNNKYLAIIQKNSKRLLSLADQLITFRKAEEGYLSLNLSKNTLGDFIYPSTEAFENYATEKNINFFFKVNSPNEEIIIDVEKTERVIFNLLSNAFKHTPTLGNISIEAEVTMREGQKMIRIDVIDNGKGIPKADLENIFERFYQLGNKKDTISGGGIGLAFCKTLVELLGGEISVSSTPKVETRFSVILPSKTIEKHGPDTINFSNKSFIKDWIPLAMEDIKEDPETSLAASKKKHKLLIVENEVDVQTFLKSALSQKYTIRLANNGLEALKKIEEQEPDLIISDVMMPKMDGFELCEKIKTDAKTCHIPILLLTALGENEDLIKGLEFGADEYISKPFSLYHLKLRIGKLIQNKVRLLEYFSKNSSLPKKDIEISTRDKEFLSKIIEVIEENMADSNFGVQELADTMALSSAHFYRRLKQLTGQIPNVYLRNFRLQRAAELLRKNEGHNVTEVMYEIGIESNSYFSTSFKKLHGVSPSEYLKQKVNTPIKLGTSQEDLTNKE